jgi:MFS family permease
VRKLKARKPVALYFSFTYRFAWVALIGLMYLDIFPGERVYLMILILFLSNVCIVIASNAYFSWMADLVPPTIRGAYYGRRNTYLGFTSMTTLFIGSQVLSFFQGRGETHIGFTLCFAVAVASAMISSFWLNRQYEPMVEPVHNLTIAKIKSLVNESPLLKKYMVFYSIWQFGLGTGAAFFGIYMVRVLEMTPAQMGYQALIASVATIAGSYLWGKARDRVGDRATLIASGVFVSVNASVWVFSEPKFLWPVWVLSVGAGFGWAGFNIMAFSWPQKFCSKKDNFYVSALIGLFSGPAFLVGSLLGGALTTYLPLVLFRVGGFEFMHYHLVFCLTAGVRGLAIVLLTEWSKPYVSTPRGLWRCLRDCFGAMVSKR